jgi:hypothetical protein
MSAGSPRYTAEAGTDGSFLLVDHGQDRAQRIAIERFTDASEARDEAATLSSLDEVTGCLPRSPDPFWDSASAATASYAASLNEERNFNHLLREGEPAAENKLTTIDGGAAELHPCPPFCTGSHFRQGDPPWPGDPFFHHGTGTEIHAVDHAFDTDARFRVYPEAWVPHLTDAPEPAVVGLDVRMHDGDALMSMTPAEARAFAAALEAAADAAESTGRGREGH